MSIYIPPTSFQGLQHPPSHFVLSNVLKLASTEVLKLKFIEVSGFAFPWLTRLTSFSYISGQFISPVKYFCLWPFFLLSSHFLALCFSYIPALIFCSLLLAPHSSTLAWKIPWMEEPGGLQSMGSLTVGHDWATSLSLSTCMHWRRKWQPTPVFLPGESLGQRSLVGCSPWGHTESDTTEAT